ncbi:MAG: class I SAM-dependent methyltransferase [Candidatus Omnitrophota bacterium]
MKNEKDIQEEFSYYRCGCFESYNKILGYYQALSCIENGRDGIAIDLACGDGMLTSYLCQHYERVVGVDASTAHLSKAKILLPGIEFHNSLIEDLDISEKFDSVFLINVLEHVLDPGIVLQKAATLLNSEGVLIVHVPNAMAVNRKIAVIMETLESYDELSPYDINVVGHRRSYTLDTLRDDVETVGLNVYKVGGIFFKMLSTPQMDWFLKNGPWDEGGFGWGRVGGDKKDWRAEFCRACYEYGKERPEDCNIIYVCAKRKK